MSIGVYVGAPRAIGKKGVPVPTLILSSFTVSEDAAIGSVVAALSVANGSGSYTYAITSDPDNKFAIDGSNLETEAALNYEAASYHLVTIEADNGVDDPISTPVVILVSDVYELPVPVNTVAPTLSPTTADLDDEITCGTGTWTNSPTSYDYQWMRDSVDIGGATASTHTVVSADQGTTLTCKVRANNAGGPAAGYVTTSNSCVVSEGSFSPLDLPDLVAWYDATAGVYKDAGSTLAANNETVQQWNDQSGHGYHLTQSTSGDRPTFKTSSINALPALEFAADWLVTAFDTVALGAVAAHSAFMVIEFNTSGGNTGMIGYSGNGIDANYVGGCALWLYDNAAGSVISYANGGGTGTALSVTNGVPLRAASVYDGVNVTLYKDNTGTTPTAFTAGVSSPGTITVGAIGRSGISAGLQAKIAEIIVLSDDPTSQERSDINTYLGNKWGF